MLVLCIGDYVSGFVLHRAWCCPNQLLKCMCSLAVSLERLRLSMNWYSILYLLQSPVSKDAETLLQSTYIPSQRFAKDCLSAELKIEGTKINPCVRQEFVALAAVTRRKYAGPDMRLMLITTTNCSISVHLADRFHSFFVQLLLSHTSGFER